MSTFFDTLRLLVATVYYRPYVYAFLVCFLVLGMYQMGTKRTLTFLTSTWLIAFGCEYSSTRNGFPFGPYQYYDATRARELWISNVPFWDSLSFIFLSYFSFVIAAHVLRSYSSRYVPWLGGFLMMLLDVVIDPVALQGEKWFLGKIYDYPFNGFYFGVTAANFAGWFFVGFASQWVFQRFLAYAPWCRGKFNKVHRNFIWCCYGVYAGVFLFNLGITIYIQDYKLAKASAILISITLASLAILLKAIRHENTGLRSYSK